MSALMRTSDLISAGILQVRSGVILGPDICGPDALIFVQYESLRQEDAVLALRICRRRSSMA